MILGIFFFLSSAHFLYITQFTKFTWVACKKLQPQLLWSYFTPTICCPLHTPVPMDDLGHLAQAASIPTDVLHSLCMTQFRMWLPEQELSHQPQKGIASDCKCFCHLLHWRLQPCQCHRQGIASDCSKCHEINALPPERNAPLTPGCIFNRTWALVALCLNYYELAVMTWYTFVSHISFRVFPSHFKMTLMQPEWVANRLFYLIAPRGGFLHPTLWLGRTRRALAKEEAWKMGGCGKSLIP